MNKGLIIGIVILLALIIIGGLVYYLVLMPSKYSVPITTPITAPNVNINAPVNTMPVNQVPTMPVTVTPPVSNGAKIINITIANFAFNPANVSISKGDTVKWTNDDQVPHQIAIMGSNSQVLNTGESYSITFEVAGSFDYHCNIHPSMTGNVTVK